MMNKVKDIIQGILVIALYFITTTFAGLIISLLPFDYSTWSETAKYILTIVYEFIQLLIFILILHKKVFKDAKEWFSSPLKYLREYIKYYGLMLMIMYISNVLIMKIFNLEIAANEQSIRSLIKSSPFVSCAFICFIAPVLEELVFRLSFYKILKKWPIVFIALSGLIFGSMHLIGSAASLIEWIYIIPYGAPGCILAYTLYKSDNICVPISLHMINNTFSYVVQLVSLLFI